MENKINKIQLIWFAKQNGSIKFLWVALILVLSFLGLAKSSWAENFYIAQNQAGTNDGSTCANARAVDWFNTTTNWANPKQSGKIGPGDTAHLCGTISTSLMVRGSGAAGNPVIILFESNAKLSAPTWTGAWWGVEGAIQANNVNYIILDGGSNGVIEATNSGTNLQQVGSMGVMFAGVSNSEIKNLTINNMYVRTSTAGEDGGGCGIYISAGSNNSIHDNRISETQTAIVYVYPQGGLSENIKIYRNTINRINWGIILGESDINALADNVQIYSNDIGDMYNWDDPENNFHHDGIYAFAEAEGDKVTNLKVYNNYIHGDMGLHITAMIFSSGNVINPLYFNNVLVNTGTNGISNGFIRGVIGSRIYNNTFIDHGTSMGIDTEPGSDIKNNLFYNNTVPVAVHQPVDTSTHSDYNILFYTGEMYMVTFVPVTGNGLFYSLADWRKTFNLDLNSLTGDPLLVRPDIVSGNYHLQASSPAINSGMNLASYCADTPELCLDKDGKPRPQSAAWDIGAYEYVPGSDTTPPAAPTGLSVR